MVALKMLIPQKKIKLPKSLGQWYIFTNGHNYSTVDPVQLSQKFYSGRMATVDGCSCRNVVVAI